MSVYTKDWKPSEFKLKERYWATLPGHEDDPRVIRVESVGKLTTGEHGLVIDELGYSYTFESMKSLGVKLGPRIDPPREDDRHDVEWNETGYCATCAREVFDGDGVHRKNEGDEARHSRDECALTEIRIPVAQRGSDFAWWGNSSQGEVENRDMALDTLGHDFGPGPFDRVFTARIPIPAPQPDIEVEGEVEP